jgi:hypothetical protein
VDARPAAEDRLAQQPKEPSREEKKAEFNAEQARRIEELFFWCERMLAREETFQTRMNLHISLAIFAARRTLATTHDATLMPTCAAPAQERRLFKGPKLRVIKAGSPSRGGPGFASRLRTREGAGICTVLNGKCGTNTTSVPPVHPTLI